MHYLTLPELQRIVLNTPGNEALADLLDQVRSHVNGASPVRVDLEKLLRKPDETKGFLPPAVN